MKMASQPSLHAAFDTPQRLHQTVSDSWQRRCTEVHAMSADQLEWRYCDECGQDRAFEVPACCDGHGGDCPDRICTRCGDAVTIGEQPDEHPVALVHVA